MRNFGRCHLFKIKRSYQNWFCICFTLLFVAGCSDQSPDFETMVQNGRESDETNNELFLGYELGMDRETFRQMSWELNQQKKLTGLVKMEYVFDDLEDQAVMSYYPEFENNVITRIPIDVNYQAWSPWNEQFSSDSLVIDLKDHFENEFSTEFENVFIPYMNREGWVSVEGNRLIAITRKNDMLAFVEFVDLNAVDEL